MPKIQLKYSKGVQPPAKLGTVILKPTAEGYLSYTQNVEVNNDEYGQGVLVPGPALNTLTGNSEITGVPFAKAFYGSSVGYLYFAEGLLGNTNRIRRIKDILNGSIPSVDSSGSMTATHSGHSSVVIDDMTFRATAIGTNQIYIVGRDATDRWVQYFDPASPSLTGAQTLANSGAYEHKIHTAQDNKVYVGHNNLLDSISTVDVKSNGVLDIKVGWGVTALDDWNNFLAIAASHDDPFTFAQRKQGQVSGIFLWDFVSSSFEKDPIICPSRYISAMLQEPDGNLLVFGGLEQGKTTLYEFTGYGYNVLYSYIGDMPRNNHAVSFDAEGRIIWLTVDGYLCRYDKRNRIFDQLNVSSVSGQYGGFVSKLLNTAGYEFVIAGGLSSGPSYFAKRVSFGNYIGDDDAEDVDTPLAVTGLLSLPPRSMIECITISLQKNLAIGDKIEVRLYKDGSASYSTLGTLSFATDGAIAGKKIYLRKYGMDNFCIGFAWKMTDNSTAAPGIVSAELEFKPLR